MSKVVKFTPPRKKNKFLLGAGLVVSVLIALAAPLLLLKQLPSKLPAIVQIGDANRPNCSAFVISDRYAVTARHCVMNNMLAMMLGIPDYKKDITLYHAGEPVGEAKTVWNRLPTDAVALEGDFTGYHHLKAQSNVIYMDPEDKYKACGYPYGTHHLICSDIKLGVNFTHAYTGTGYITFGFSGGPVINISQGVAIGVNSAIAEGYMIFTPLIALKQMLNLEDDL